ncbi:MAG: hypothetical protein MUF03_13310 [Rubrivivax sp.]|jgi:hypothetical protein|nr:hypothetical protein [Rubrivivax sp.]
MTSRTPLLRPLAAALLVAAAAPQALAEASPWYVGVSQSFIHDSNLYRIDDGVALPPGVSRSDLVSVTSLVGGLDQPIGRQRLFGSLRLDNNSYRDNDDLDATTYAVSGGVDWSTAERLSGRLSFAGSERQKTFNTDRNADQVPETEKNLERVNQLDFVARLGNVTRLTLEAGAGYRAVDYSAPDFAPDEYEQARGSLGVRYRPGVATFGAGLSVAETDYNLSLSDNRRTAVDFTASWPGTGASSLFVRLSPTRVEYDDFSPADFDGLTGSLRWNWVPTGKLTVDTRLVHDIGQDSSFETFGGPVVIAASATGRTTTELRVDAVYALTGKIALDASLAGQHRELEAFDPVTGAVRATGKDDTVRASLGARWTPLRSVLVGCTFGLDQRWAAGPFSQDYDARTINCYGQFTLQ